MNHRRAQFGALHGRVVFACILLALVYVPIPLGSNRPHAWFIWETGIYGLLAFWALGLVANPGRMRISASSARILTVLVAWLSLVFLHCLPLPAGVVSALNPVVHALRQDLGLISVGAAHTLSVDPGNSYNEFLKYGSYIALFAMTLATVATKTRLLTAAGVIIVAGVLEGLFGIYSHVTGYVIFPETGAANELRAGTFVNRNHYANLLTMSLGLVIGLMTSIINTQREGSRLKLSLYKDVDLAILLVLLGAALVIVAGILVSGSRAPIVFFTLSFGALLVIAWSGRRSGTGEFVLAPLVLLGVAAAIVAMGFDESFVRLLDRDLLGGERMLQNVWGFTLLSSVWLTGVGAGNYQWVFPMFRSDDLRFVTYDYAHNDYLQTAIEQGIPGAAVLALGVFLIIREMYRGYRGRRHPLIRGVLFGCLLSTGFMLLHALVEFSFRIPANAVYFFVIAAVGIAACRIERGTRRSSRSAENTGADE